MQDAGRVEKALYLAVADFGTDSAGLSVAVALPASLFGDGLEHLGGGSPTLFGRLCQVAVCQFLSDLLQETLAGLLILPVGHWWLLRLFLHVSRPKAGRAMEQTRPSRSSLIVDCG